MTEIDEIIEEVRRSRCHMSEQCGHDVHEYIECLKKLNSRYAAQVEDYRKSRSASTQASATRE